MDKSLILNEIKLHYGIKSDTDFANFLGIKPQVLSNWKARNSFDYDLIYTKCLDISGDWLLTGKGEMLKITKEEFVKKEYKNDNKVPFNDLDVSVVYLERIVELKYTIELQMKYIEKLELDLKKDYGYQKEMLSNSMVAEETKKYIK